MMTNNGDGRSVIFSTALAKEFDNGLYASVSYAHQDVNEVAPGSSSRAQSNYKHAIVQSRNVDMVGRGYYEVEHSLKINYVETQFFDGYNTRSMSSSNVVLVVHSTQWASTMMATSVIPRFWSNSAYLAYIPSGADDANVNWEESSLQWNELEALLNRTGISERFAPF